jgi:hypothetical protein
VFGFVYGEAEHGCPTEGRDPELAITFDHAESLCVLFEELGERQ